MQLSWYEAWIKLRRNVWHRRLGKSKGQGVAVMGQACQKKRTDRERVLPPYPARINKEAKSRREKAEKNFCGFWVGSLSWRFPQYSWWHSPCVTHTHTHTHADGLCDCGDFRWCRAPDGTAGAPRATGSHCAVAAETSLFMSDMFFCLFSFLCL